MALFGRRTPDIVLDTHPAKEDVVLRSAFDAAKADDWSAVPELMASSRADFDRRSRYTWVLADSVVAAPWGGPARDPDGGVPQVDTTAAWPDRWADAEPENPDAHLMRARSLITRAWEVRGSGWARTVGPDSFAEFRRVVELAVPVCHRAADLAPDDPSPWAVLLLACTALGDSRSSADLLWNEIVARDPLHREGHNFRLMYLCQKWYGSHEEMYAFAREASATAPTGSGLLLLPLQAHAEWAMRVDSEDQDARRFSLKVVRHWLEDERLKAELDVAMSRWFAVADPNHPFRLHDLNYLAYALHQASRYREAKPVLAAIGPYREDLPWVWYLQGRSFHVARRKAKL